jgi:uncharacterized protein YdeI (YjbR/CyaY-like superfamily)
MAKKNATARARAEGAKRPKAKPAAERFPLVEPDSRRAYREWLEANHAGVDGIWLVYRKKMGAGSGYDLTYDAAVEEALCFGWIDSVVSGLDERRWKWKFTPRKPGSMWSALNKRRISALEAAGQIAGPGRTKIEAAKADGSWTILDSVEAPEVPDEFARAMAAERVRAEFDALTPSRRKPYLYRLVTAKTEATRARRIGEAVAELGRLGAGRGKEQR